METHGSALPFRDLCVSAGADKQSPVATPLDPPYIIPRPHPSRLLPTSDWLLELVHFCLTPDPSKGQSVLRGSPRTAGGTLRHSLIILPALLLTQVLDLHPSPLHLSQVFLPTNPANILFHPGICFSDILKWYSIWIKWTPTGSRDKSSFNF